MKKQRINYFKIISLLLIILYIIIIVKNNNRYININISCYMLIFFNILYIGIKQKRVIKKGGKK